MIVFTMPCSKCAGERIVHRSGGHPIVLSAVEVRSLLNSAQAWVKCVPQSIPDEIKGSNGEQDRQPRKERQIGMSGNVITAVADHYPPFGRWGLRAESNETQSGRSQDRSTHIEAGLHQQGRQTVRQDMPPHNMPWRSAQAAGGRYILELAQR